MPADATWEPSLSYVDLDQMNTENHDYEQLFRLLSELLVLHKEHDQDNELSSSPPVRRANFWKRANVGRKRANFWKRDLA